MRAKRASLSSSLAEVSALIAACALASACNQKSGPALEKTDDEGEIPVPVVAEPPASGPKLGALSDVTPVVDRPSRRGLRLGYLHAGALVVRAAEPIGTRGCEGGWFPIRPRGFVCASGSATLELRHPTLAAMAIGPELDAPLPYTYARASRDSSLYEADPEHEGHVRAVAPLEDGSGLAVVGSWTAIDPEGKDVRLAMTTDGRFVPTADLMPAASSRFAGKALGDRGKLPIAFVVRRGVHRFGMRDGVPEKQTPIEYHTRIELTGHMVTLDDVDLWETDDGGYVRARDVTVVRERHELPAFVTDDQRWLDVSVMTGAVVAYEGAKPVYATLASVGRDRLGGPGADAITQRGEFPVVAKHVTLKEHDPATLAEHVSIYDAPWALVLSSGQLVLGAYWHDRFGIEHGPGNVELSPADAAWIFRFLGPEVPEGWHGATDKLQNGKPAIVNIRK
ncbi:MAG TPA: L,D-transpeptidase [Polyangiaceae bacterium]|nr:L,D-transpeptidase [Polyangiaceae bacterium]